MSKERKSYRSPRGVRDVLPEDVPFWRHLEGTAARLAHLRGFREIRPALLEETEVFIRSVGEVTDIVEKEMFTLQKGDTSLSLRPEGTAGIVRAYVQAGYGKTAPVQKFYHLGPMFRYERPQKGRERMFTQFDVEALGSLDPRLDAEVIGLAVAFFGALGMDGLEVRVSSMGDGEDRDRFREALQSFLRPNLAEHCDLCRSRFERNVLRILDCKNPKCRELIVGAPQMIEHLSAENRAHMDEVTAILNDAGISWKIDGGLVRGLDYYTRTVFEVHDPRLGARSAVCGGGRYDHLIEDLGGPDLGAVGFAIGFTGTMIAMRELGLDTAIKGEVASAYVVAAGEEPELARSVYAAAEELRAAGISAVYDHEKRRVKGQMKQASKGGHRFAVLIGTAELERDVVQIKELETGEQREVTRADMVGDIQRVLGEGGA